LLEITEKYKVELEQIIDQWKI